MREIKFRAWHNGYWRQGHISIEIPPAMIYDNKPGDCLKWKNEGQNIQAIMQFTGLLDKNGLTDIYEGDILDENGVVKGNVYEPPQIFREGIDCIIANMGTSAWRGPESIAMGRGCKYAE